MIEVVAIDNRTAEADILRLAASFAQDRLFVAKQRKKLTVLIEVTGLGSPQPVSRAQLATKPGLFKGSRFQFDLTASVAHGLEMGVLQIMHEMTHLSQVVNNRYQLTPKKVKIDGERQSAFAARWLGKKQGLVDDQPWQDRPWEQEASLTGNQLAAEFMAMIQGQQVSFPAQGAKKELRLYDVAFALPEMPAPQMVSPLPTPESVMPESGMPESGMPESVRSAVADHSASPQSQDDDLMADIDAILAADGTQSQSLEEAPAMSDANALFGAPLGVPSFDMPSEVLAADPLPSAESEAELPMEADKKTFVLGVAEPRILKAHILATKRQELAKRGLLEK